MKISKHILFLAFIGYFAFGLFNQHVFASTASIKVTTLLPNGSPIATNLLCSEQKSAVNGVKPKPTWYYPATNSSGIGTFTVTPDPNATYQCRMLAAVIKKDGACYFSAYPMSETKLSPGQVFNVTYTYVPVGMGMCENIPEYTPPQSSPVSTPKPTTTIKPNPKVTPTPTPIATSTPSPTPIPLNYNLPEIFRQPNSTSTDLSKLTLDELKNVENFTVEIPGKNKVVFKGKIDLSSEELRNSIQEAIKIDEIAKVSIDSKKFPELNKSIEITMYSLDFSEKPNILKNGSVVESITGVDYDKSKKELIFSDSDPGDYLLSKKESIEKSGVVDVNSPSNFSYFVIAFIFAILLFIIVVIALLIWYFRRKKR